MTSTPLAQGDKELFQPPLHEVAEEIHVRGTVQGVGFRPTVYRLANACQLRGTVWNDGQGVVIRVSGSQAALEEFVQRLQQECPPLAKIEQLDRVPLAEPLTQPDFTITPSVNNAVHTGITPDAAICPQCRTEIFDPFSRWYRYPFTNCTHCGPRLSIVRAIPYDRRHTSMAMFPLCPECERDYQDVTNRRFHAQPIACHLCGPQVWLQRSDGKPITASMFSMLDEVDAVCTLLQRGAIVAIKGIGGFHLACDATHETAVRTLRDRKHREHKPFALMARDLEVIEQYCLVTASEKALLESPAAPIVLLQRRKDVYPATDGVDVPAGKQSIRKPGAIAPSVAPEVNTLGMMLPYTPLHQLILKRMDRPIVLTSGNLSEEPQCIDNQAALTQLSSIADYFVLHDREIVNRVDDSVVRVVADQVQVLRRARGYAPAPIRLPVGFETAPPLLAMGSELKNTFCLLRDGEAILSQHLGDLENAAALTAYQETLNLYLSLFEHQPGAIAMDLHPEYLSTKLGEELAIADSLPIHRVQHHHAHVAACMAENHLPLSTAPVLGIALDGLGYGADGTLWGGEFLLADYRQFQRLASLKPVVMLGGEQAIYQPWRNTYAHLKAAFDWEALQQTYGDLELIAFLQKQPRSLLDQMLQKGIHSPLASSGGRLFDAVAAALEICRESASYEGQGAIALESLAEQFLASRFTQRPPTCFGYPFAITQSSGSTLFTLEPRPMWQALLTDLQQKVSNAEMAARFHLGFATAIVKMVGLLQQHHEFTQVALTGGVFQNCLLMQQVGQQLASLGVTVLTHRLVPANDGGLSLGQLAIAAARSLPQP